MLAIARIVVVLCMLAGCGLPTPAPNANPCERAPGTEECQVFDVPEPCHVTSVDCTRAEMIGPCRVRGPML